MGKNDYQKSYSRQMESIIISICAIYSFTELILGYRNGWNPIGQIAVLCSILVSWIFFFGKYKSYEIRAYITVTMSQITILVYAIEIGSFYSVLSVFISLCILLGLYGIPKAMIIPVINYTIMLLYFIFVNKSLVWGTYSSDLGMITRILQGYLVMFVIVFLVHRYQKSEESMLEMIHALKKSEREKDDFLANVSHEIRTPINTICGISEIMLKNGVPTEMQEDVLNIQSAGRNLVSVIGDILDYSELQEGEFELVEENYYISSTIYDVINMSMAKKSEKNIEFIVDCDATMPSVLIGDEQKVRRVIMNLVNNAIEFTTEGCVCLQIGYRKEEYGINLIVSIRDTGIGMSKEDIEKLFNKFSQVDMGRSREKGGVGLGLAIAQAIINKMGGFISVKSVLGKGSEFRFVVPQKVYDDKPLVEVPNASAIKAAVYINMEQFDMSEIRDEYAASIKHILEQTNVDCHICRNLAELKRWEKREEYTHVFISYMEYMEDPAYFDSLAKRVRLNLIIDHYDDIKVHNKLIGRIYKPFSILGIVSALKENVENGNIVDIENHQLYAPDARILVIDDNRMNIRVVEGLMREYGVQVTSALSGADGIKLLESNNFDFVFLDHMMPEMDGVETLHNIRRKNDPYFKSIPIVALTANAIAGTREMLLREGFDDFVAKPVENSVLQRTLKKYIPREKQISIDEAKKIKALDEKKAISEQNKKVEAKKQRAADVLEIGDLDISKGIMYCGNEDNYLEILVSQRDSGQEIMEEIQNLYDREDWKNYTIAVHGIKSSMMSIGAVNLSEMAKSLEFAGKAEKYDVIRTEHDGMIKEFCRVMKILEECEYLGPKEVEEEVVAKEAIASEVFASKLSEMENAMYELDGAKMEGILDELGNYSYGGKDLQKELQSVYKKIEMSDLMAAYAAVEKVKAKLD